MTVRQGAPHDDALPVGRRRGAALEQRAQPLDEFGRPIRQIGNGAFFDLGAVAKALAQQDSGRRIPVRNRFDIHGDNITTQDHIINKHFTIYMATFYWPFSGNSIKSKAL